MEQKRQQQSTQINDDFKVFAIKDGLALIDLQKRLRANRLSHPKQPLLIEIDIILGKDDLTLLERSLAEFRLSSKTPIAVVLNRQASFEVLDKLTKSLHTLDIIFYASPLLLPAKDVRPSPSANFQSILPKKSLPKKILKKPHDFIHSRQHFLNWFILAFLAGTVNVGGYMACHRFVTHVTGFATMFGADIAVGNIADGLSMLSVPLFFILGAMISGFYVERRLHRHQSPKFGLVMGLMTLCLFLAFLGGISHWFGVFGEGLVIKNDYLLMALLCTASGLQNAVITSVSGALVRTTHLTGITTDLGVGIIRILFPDRRDEYSGAKERKLNKLRLGSIISFIFGSGLGAFVYSAAGYYGFLLPTGMGIYITLVAVFFWQQEFKTAER